MLVFINTALPLQSLCDGSKAHGAFTASPRQVFADGNLKCIGVSVTGVRTNSPDHGQRIFTVCVCGPAILAGCFKANFFTGCGLYWNLTQPEQEQFTTVQHRGHTRLAFAAHEKGERGEKIGLLLDTDCREYNSGAFIFFLPLPDTL